MKTKLLIITACLVFVAGCASTSNVHYFNDYYKRDSINSIALLYIDISGKWSPLIGENREIEGPKKAFVEDFGDSVKYIFNKESILFSEFDTLQLYTKEQLEILTQESEEIRTSIYSKNNQAGIYTVKPNFDFSEAELNINSNYGLIVFLSENSSANYSSDSYGSDSIIELYSYLIDIRSDSLVWVKNDFFGSSLRNSLYDEIAQSLLMSIKYGKDVNPISFDLDDANTLTFIEQGGETYKGKILQHDGLEITIKPSSGNQFTRNLVDIKKITKPAPRIGSSPGPKREIQIFP